MPIETWFPTCIYWTHFEKAGEEKESLLSRIAKIQQDIQSGGSHWVGRVYTTLGTYSILEDPVFAAITEFVEQQANVFAKDMGYDTTSKPLTAHEGWINVYSQSQWQEFHCHAGSIFSAVYYLNMPPSSSKIIFESPLEPDMMVLPTLVSNPLNYKTAEYLPGEGQLLIFRSYLRHAVASHASEQPRISLAFNLK